MTQTELTRLESMALSPLSHGMDVPTAQGMLDLIKYIRTLEKEALRLQALCSSHEEYIQGEERDDH